LDRLLATARRKAVLNILTLSIKEESCSVRLMFGMKPTEGGCMDVFGPKTSEIQRKATRTGAVSNSFMVKVRMEGDHVLANLLITLIYVKE
jgi:hypothetical protein